MEKLILKPEIIVRIQNDPIAIGNIAAILGVNFTSMPRMLLRNDIKFTQAGVLKYLRERFKFSTDADLLTNEMQPA